jgi:hypothetical protein
MCSPSYVDYRPKTVILLDTGHTLRENCIGRIERSKRNQKLEYD